VSKFALPLLLLPTCSWGASFIPLGDLTGGTGFYNSQASGMSADGRVVVGTSSSATHSGNEPFRWTRAEGMTGLGMIEGGEPGGGALGTSADGGIIVGTGRRNQAIEAFRWSASTGMVGIGAESAAFPSFAVAVSADGSRIAGQSQRISGPEATLWLDGVVTGLGDLPGGEFRSGVNAISADGSVMVGAGTPASGTAEAFRWTASEGMVGLGFLPGGTFSTATAISGTGAVIAGWSGSSLGGELAFLWTAAGIASLGDLPGGNVQSQAHDISAGGTVVVGSSSWGDAQVTAREEAFLWTAATGMQRLFDVLVARGAAGLDGWVLRDATAISGDGAVIAGWGIDPRGRPQAFVADLSPVPLPGTWGLLLTAVLAGALSRSSPWRLETVPTRVTPAP